MGGGWGGRSTLIFRYRVTSLFHAEESNSTRWHDVSIPPNFRNSVQSLAIENITNTSVTFYIQEMDKPNKCIENKRRIRKKFH